MNILDLPIDVYKIIYDKIDNIVVLKNIFICNRKLRNNLNSYYFLNHTINMMSRLCLNFYYKYMKYLLKYNSLLNRLDNISTAESNDSDSSLDIDHYIDYE